MEEVAASFPHFLISSISITSTPMDVIPSKKGRGLTRTQWRDLRNGLLFISPWIIGFSVFLAYPIVMSLYYSLCDFSVLQPPRFIGLRNYSQLFQDDVFQTALWNTVYYAAGAIPLGIILAIAIAMLLNTGVRGMAVYRTIFFLPSLVPSVAMAILWLWIFNGKAGILNFALQQLAANLGAVLIALGSFLLAVRAVVPSREPGSRFWRVACGPAALLGVAVLVVAGSSGQWAALGSWQIDPPSWLSKPLWVKPAFILMSLWGTGNAVVIYLAGLQDVPVHLYEAADLDGAHWWQKVRHVTLPMLSPVILFNGIMAIIGTFNYFAIPFVMAPGGQPARSAYFLAVNLFDNAFQYLRMGYASAMAWILFAIVFVLTMLAMKLSERHVHYGDS
jgi:multiple sugar transport system permease protein